MEKNCVLASFRGFGQLMDNLGLLKYDTENSSQFQPVKINTGY